MSPPSPMKPDDLDRALTEMSTWEGPEPELWKVALNSNDAKPRGDGKWRHKSILSKPLSNRLILTAVGCIALVLVVGALLPSLGKARMSSRVSYGSVENEPEALAASSPRSMAPTLAGAHVGIQGNLGGSREEAKDGLGVLQGQVNWAANDFDGPLPKSAVGQSAPSPRYVVQKATMELQTEDVRAAFAKAAYVVSAAGGEFVESSSLTGDGKLAQGNMTLRVAAARVGEVMNKLRELGTVRSENTTGEDVTTQVVDVEARIRNEQRVEKELLELLDKRNDAPLKDVLELRSSLSGVRQSIEQLVGQRDRLGRLVSLASILVVIRAQPEEFKPAPASTIGDYFTKVVTRAWRGGLQSLSDTVAWLVAVAVGGVMWWAVLAIIMVSIVRWRRRLSARCV